jgi:hypothetical protein
VVIDRDSVNLTPNGRIDRLRRMYRGEIAHFDALISDVCIEKTDYNI